MHEFADWSVGLGRWRGVPVRIHLLFVLFLVLLLVLASTQPSFDFTLDSALAAAVLLVSVALHEVAHLLTAKRFGGWVHEVVIGPFGGLVRPGVPDLPKAHVMVALAGPVANLLLAAILAAVLVAWHGSSVLGLLNVFAPVEVIEGPAPIVALRLGVWLNWLLALVNLLPVFPFDGAVAYRSALRPWLGGPTAAVYVARGGFLCSLLLIGLAWWSRTNESLGSFPIWLPLLFAAVFVAFSAHRDTRRIYHPRSENADRVDRVHDQDLDDDWIDFEEDPVDDMLTAADAWRTGYPRAGDGGEGQPWCSADDDVEEAQLDNVLAKLHVSGIDALSLEERQLLDRASRRYRRRLQKGSAEDA